MGEGDPIGAIPQQDVEERSVGVELIQGLARLDRGTRNSHIEAATDQKIFE